jgi:hypothetical protein
MQLLDAVEGSRLPVRWNRVLLEPAQTGGRDGAIEISRGARGMLATVRLHRRSLTTELAPQLVAVAALRAADRFLGTEVGHLEPPQAARGAVPAQRSGAA